MPHDQLLCDVTVILFLVQVGNDERIHVYYAHGEDKPTFVRRCYWLLDKYVSYVSLYLSLFHFVDCFDIASMTVCF